MKVEGRVAKASRVGKASWGRLLGQVHRDERGQVSIETVLIIAAISSLAQQAPSSRQAVPIDPATASLEAFRSHTLVGLGEPRRNEQAHALRVACPRPANRGRAQRHRR